MLKRLRVWWINWQLRHVLHICPRHNREMPGFDGCAICTTEEAAHHQDERTEIVNALLEKRSALLK